MSYRINELLAAGCLASVLAFPASGTMAAGFDCAAAKSRIEKTICGDEELSRLDSRLNEVFLEAQAETAGVDGETGRRVNPVGKEQRRWVQRVRAKCGNATCLKAAYEKRIADIEKNWLGK